MIVLVYLLGQQNTFYFFITASFLSPPLLMPFPLTHSYIYKTNAKGRRIPQTLATLPSQPSETKRLLLDI